MKIKTKILLALFGMLTLTVILGVVSSRNIETINERYAKNIKQNIIPKQKIMDIMIAFADVKQTSRGFTVRIMYDISQLEVQTKRLKDRIEAMTTTINSFVQELKDAGANKEIVNRAVEIQTNYNSDFVPMVEKIMLLAQQGNLAEIIELFDATNEITDKIYVNIQKINELNIAETSVIMQQNIEIADNEIYLIFGVVFLTIIMGIVIVLILSRFKLL
jgi:uncharacterized protein YwqG